MRYRKAGVSMCSEAETDEFSRSCIDSDVVKAMKSMMQMSVERVSPDPYLFAAQHAENLT